MDAEKGTLQSKLSGRRQFVIPVFQRYYEWHKVNWDRLWGDIQALLENPNEESEPPRHFIGSIVVQAIDSDTQGLTTFLVIDGQQRMLSLSLLMCAIRDEFLDRGWRDLAIEIEEDYLINRNRRDTDGYYRVFPRFRDRDAFRALIDKLPAPPESPINKGWRHFRSKVQEWLDKNGSTIASARRLTQAIEHRIDFVWILLQRENPYQIFCSLNSTGVDLEESDLIRNHVFMQLPPAAQEAFDDGPWRALEEHFIDPVTGKLQAREFAAFFREVMMRHGRYIQMNSVFHAFAREFPLNSRFKPHAVAADFLTHAKRYDLIRRRGGARHPVPEVEHALQRLRELGFAAANTLLLRLLELNETRSGTNETPTLSDADLVHCLDAIASFCLRRVITGATSRFYGVWFCRACKELGTSPLANLQNLFVELGWPVDNDVIYHFARLPLYTKRDYVRPILDGIEEALDPNVSATALRGAQVEHVMPSTIDEDADGVHWRTVLGPRWQEVHERLVHSPGNLTLVGADYNMALQRRPYEVKRPHLLQSSFAVNRHFRNESLLRWDEAAIMARAEVLAQVVCAHWPRTAAEKGAGVARTESARAESPREHLGVAARGGERPPHAPRGGAALPVVGADAAMSGGSHEAPRAAALPAHEALEVLRRRLLATGRVRNGDYREIFGTDTETTTLRLRQLVAQQKLTPMGSGRGSYYVAGPSWSVDARGTGEGASDGE